MLSRASVQQFPKTRSQEHFSDGVLLQHPANGDPFLLFYKYRYFKTEKSQRCLDSNIHWRERSFIFWVECFRVKKTTDHTAHTLAWQPEDAGPEGRAVY